MPERKWQAILGILDWPIALTTPWVITLHEVERIQYQCFNDKPNIQDPLTAHSHER